MRRRLIAWISLIALWSGLAAPAHAYAHPQRVGGMAADFCTTKSVPAGPATPHSPACDACANCLPSVLPVVNRASPVIAAGVLVAPRAATADAPAPSRAAFEARAPPPLL